LDLEQLTGQQIEAILVDLLEGFCMMLQIIVLDRLGDDTSFW
jgi:hypothetical protein